MEEAGRAGHDDGSARFAGAGRKVRPFLFLETAEGTEGTEGTEESLHGGTGTRRGTGSILLLARPPSGGRRGGVSRRARKQHKCVRLFACASWHPPCRATARREQQNGLEPPTFPRAFSVSPRLRVRPSPFPPSPPLTSSRRTPPASSAASGWTGPRTPAPAGPVPRAIEGTMAIPSLRALRTIWPDPPETRMGLRHPAVMTSMQFCGLSSTW